MKNFLLSFLCLLTATEAVAQSKYRSSLQDYYLANSIDNNRFWKRFSIAGGLHFIPGTADLHFMGFADSSYIDTAISATIKAKQSYAFYVGSYFPIALMSDKSMLVAEVELMASVSKLTYDSIPIAAKTNISAPTDVYKIGIPISLEYRSGADVLLSKEARSMFTLSAGFNFCIINSDDYDRVTPLRALPFVKAELGFFAGIGFKIRGVYYFGNSDYNYTVNYNVAHGTGDQLISKFRGSNGFNLTLVLMPFSVNWNH